MSFPLRDIEWFSRLVIELYAAGSERELFQRLVRSLDARFQPLCTMVEEVAYSMSSFRLHSGIVPFEVPNYYLAALEDSPMVIRWQTRQPTDTLHLSMMTSRNEFHRTTFYNTVCRSVGLEDQLIGTFPTAHGVALNFSVNRDTLFSDDERILMEHVRRHVAACVARLRRSAPAEAAGAALEMRVGAGSSPREMPKEIQSLLGHYFPRNVAITAGKLPGEIQRWVKFSMMALRARPPIHPLAYLRIEGVRGHLFTRLFADDRTGVATLRFSEELRVPSVLALRNRGLTERECETLHWLMNGKRDREIGAILGCSGRTAAKHVESLLRKTGTSSRQAAAHVARQWLG